MRGWIAPLVAGLGAASLGVSLSVAQAAPEVRPGDSGPPTRVIIVFAPGVSAADGARVIRDAGGSVDQPVTTVFNGAIASVSAAAIPGLARNPRIDVVELDGVVQATATQDGATWGLDRIDQRARPLDKKYTYSDAAGSGARAYIVDTGLLATHTEFTGRVGTGYTAISDGRGTTDCNGHGTHVAGTVAGTTWGVAKLATVVPVRVLDCKGSGSWSGVVAGLDWIAKNHPAGVPAVANMSLGGGASSTVDAAVNGVIAKGISVVVAAGNDNGADACNYSPARVPAAITVAATDVNDARASFSNVGSCVDIFAPGVSITSSWYTSTTATNTISGTSMASPHVAGAAALIVGANPTFSPAQVIASLSSAATPNVVTNPSGTVNALLYTGTASATSSPSPTPSPSATSSPSPTSSPSSTPTLTVPGAPTNVVATAGAKRTVDVTWTAPTSNGGSVITSYAVTAIRSDGLRSTMNVSSTSARFSLNPGTYTFTVAAVNGVGTGPAASSGTVSVKQAP